MNTFIIVHDFNDSDNKILININQIIKIENHYIQCTGGSGYIRVVESIDEIIKMLESVKL